jgi:hypothetical protein
MAGHVGSPEREGEVRSRGGLGWLGVQGRGIMREHATWRGARPLFASSSRCAAALCVLCAGRRKEKRREVREKKKKKGKERKKEKEKMKMKKNPNQKIFREKNKR